MNFMLCYNLILLFHLLFMIFHLFLKKALQFSVIKLNFNLFFCHPMLYENFGKKKIYYLINSFVHRKWIYFGQYLNIEYHIFLMQSVAAIND